MPAPSSQLADALVTVARYRLGLPRGQCDDIRAFYPDEIEGFWIVPLFDRDQGRVMVLMADGDSVVAHAGLPRAAARLAGLDVVGRSGGWVTDNIRPILDAVGGLTPGYPRYPTEAVERSADGSIRLVLEEPASWVRFAAAGGRGTPPLEDGGSGGIRHPEPVGRMVCDMTSDHRIVWTYEIGGDQVGEFAGDAAEDRPDQTPTLMAEALVAAARTELASPLATPARPVAPEGRSDDRQMWRVEFLGLPPVLVNGPEGS